MFSLAGKKALVVGIANEDSIAYGCAKAFREQGAELAITFQSAKAEPYVRPIADKLGTDIILPLDVRDIGQLDQLFDTIRQIWGHIDICLHSIAFCPKDDLHAASSIAPATASSPPWISRSIPSSAWCAALSR
jgi:enoyl-[acyl-carrier protein] reductase I